MELFVAQTRQIRGEEEVYGVPTYGTGEVVLEDGRHLQEVRQQYIGVFGRRRDARYGRERKAELGYVSRALP